jgi:hypothetical protein
MFKPDKQMIQARIESLIERGELKRDENDHQRYIFNRITAVESKTLFDFWNFADDV